jgi:hypothetical protein
LELEGNLAWLDLRLILSDNRRCFTFLGRYCFVSTSGTFSFTIPVEK